MRAGCSGGTWTQERSRRYSQEPCWCFHLGRSHVNTCDLAQRSELGDVQMSLCYSPPLQRLSVVVLRARGLPLLPDAGMSTRRRLRQS